MPMFEITGEVKHFRYRTTRVDKPFLVLPLDEEMKYYHEKLAEAAGVQVDNHVVFGVTHEGNTMYVGFNDFRVTFGWSIYAM